jgi:iron complex outermembrane receptor protein
MINSNSRTYNYYTYDNEVDNYQQDHYQLTFSHAFSQEWLLNAALHYTHGEGYFEQKKKEEDFEDYGLSPFSLEGETVSTTDLVRRKWLNNDFYGTTYSLTYDHDKLELTLGGAWNKYNGDHFGNIIWRSMPATSARTTSGTSTPAPRKTLICTLKQTTS